MLGLKLAINRYTNITGTSIINVGDFLSRVRGNGGIIENIQAINDPTLTGEESLYTPASAYKEGTLYSVIPTDGSGDFDVVRGSKKTRVDANGNVVPVGGENLLDYSEDFSQWTINVGITLTDSQTDPFGGNDATLFTAGASQNYLEEVVTTVVGNVYTFSVYLKSTGTTTVRIGLSISNPSFYKEVVLTNSWQRFSLTYTSTSISQRPKIGYFSGDNSFLVYGAQFEQSSTPGQYIPTNGTPISQLNIPALDYSTGEAGVLIEGQSTNLMPFSDSSDWGIIRAVRTFNEGITPEGNNSAIKIAANTENNSHSTGKLLNATSASSNVVGSVYLKRGGLRYAQLILTDNAANINGTSNANRIVFDLELGIITDSATTGAPLNPTSGIEDIGNGWYRVWAGLTKKGDAVRTDLQVVLQQTGIYLQNPVFIGNNIDGILLFGVQLEESSSPSSYIPTNGSTVTRLPDNISIQDEAKVQAILNGQTQYSVVFDLDFLRDDITQSLSISSGDVLNYTSLSIQSGSIRFVHRFNNVQVNLSTGQTITSGKYAYRVDGGNLTGFINGVSYGTVTNTETAPIPNLNEINISAAYGNTLQSWVNIRGFKIYPTALTDQQLIDLTT